jgi:hypothetical protein
MRRVLPILAAAAGAAAIAGCGGGAGELIVITTHGGGGPSYRVVVTGDGRGSCNGGAERVLPSQHVLDAREVERELKDDAEKRASFTNGPRGARRYVASTKDGLVTWVEGARGGPPELAKAILLVQNLKRDTCPGGGA